MFDTQRRFRPVMVAPSFALLVAASACDPAVDPVVDAGQVSRDQSVQVDEWSGQSVPKIDEEFAQLLYTEMGPAAGNPKCKLDSFRFRLAEDKIAIAQPPGGFFTPFPSGIPNFADPVLQNSYIFVVTMRDSDDNIVGFASEQELADLVNNESITSYTITLPDRGTLMLTERESFQVLIDAVNDMVADGVTQRTFDPPLVEVLTIPGTGRVVGGSGEFKHKFGIMQEIGIVYEINLLENAFDVGVIVQALHC